MTDDQDKATPREREPFQVDSFRPEDAEGIVRLFRAVYGEHYPIRLFYDPAALTAANAEGLYYSIVARTTSGKIIGVEHLFRSAPYPSLYEAGVGMVLKEYRNAGANTEMLRFLYDDFVPMKPNIEETFGEAVCYHPYMQQAVKGFKHVFTAIEVALMPAETYGKEKKTSSRVATLNGFRCYKPKPHRIFLPAAYERELHEIYDGFDDARELALSEGELPRTKPTRAELILFDFAQVARIAVHATGEDFRSRVAALESEAQAKKAVVFQVWLNLTEPWVGEAVDTLREMGYFFGGALPRWFDGDGFLMQKLLCPPDFDDIVLVSDRAKRLLEIIRQDWERALSEGPGGI
jgi:hypothetical protein